MMDPHWATRPQDLYPHRHIGVHKGASTSAIKSSHHSISRCILYMTLINFVEFALAFHTMELRGEYSFSSPIANTSLAMDTINQSDEHPFGPLNADEEQEPAVMSQFGQATSAMIPDSLSKTANKTQNETDSQQVMEEGERALIIGIITTNIVIFVIGFFGNAIVILVILKFTRTETVTDIYILNLAMADLMFTTGLIFLTTTMFVEHWIFGNLMCKLYMATTSLNQFASSLLLVVMSFDRFLAVCHPIYAQRFRRTRRAKIICLGIWIICLILMSPIFAFAKISPGPGELTCAIFWPDYKSFNCEVAFTLYSFAIGFAVPLLLIAGFYTCVIRKLRIAASGPINIGSRRSRSRESANRRIEHLVIGIICTYTICWLPYWIAQLCVSFSTGESSPVVGFYEIFLVATCLSYTNSALNPILYAFLSDNFKRRCSDIFQTIYSLKWCKSSHCNSSHSTVTTACCEQSEISRPDSRQNVVLNETVGNRLLPSPTFNSDLICGTNTMTSALGNNQTLRDQREQQLARSIKAQNNTIHINNSRSNNNNNNGNNNNKKGDSLDGSGSVYCGERKKSVVFSASTIAAKGEDGNKINHGKNQLGDLCQNV